MKKTLLLIVLLALTFTLFACDPYNVDSFREGDMVDMSYDDVATLLSTVDWEAAGEAMQLDIRADISIQSESSSNFFGTDMQSSADLSAVFDSTTYVQYSDTIADVALHSESNVEFDYENTSTVGTSTTTTAMSGDGELNVYFYEGYLYVNPSIQMTSGGTEVSVNGKEKLNEEVTQDMWDEFNSEFDSEFMDVPDLGGMTSIYNLPTEIIALLDEEHVADFLEAFPLVTVYQKGTVTDIHFEVSKAMIAEHLEDLINFIYDTGVEAGEITDTENRASDIADAMSEINDYLEYFESFSMTMDIVLDEGSLVRYEVSMDVQTTDGSLDDWGTAIDVTFTVVANFGVSLPSFPNDLDDYVPVDEIGENYDLSPLTTL